MNSAEIVTALKAIGKECFVSYFHLFIDHSLSSNEIAKIIHRDRNYTINSCKSRTAKARSIIFKRKTRDALEIICESDKIDYNVKISAKKLLNNEQPPIIADTIINKTENTTQVKFQNTETAEYTESKKTCNYKFPNLTSDVEMELAIIIGKICYHIHPEIAHYIADSNLSYKSDFERICHPSCGIESFFYNKSDCVFPGFRRPINKEKNEKWKNNVSINDGTILNDNTFPRHIWAYLSTNKAYSGGSAGMWTNSGLSQFELSHIFGHKQDERKLESEVFKVFIDNPEPYGLFTSASNVVLIPKGFAKPTDQLRSIKICFYKRHLDLYGNNIIGLDKFDESSVPSWFSEIKWNTPVKPHDWKVKIDNLLEYRKNYLSKKYLTISNNNTNCY